MPDIVLYTLTSLDGATADPHRYFPETGDAQGGAPVFDDELARLEGEMISRQGSVLLGRRTYDEWSRYWPTSNEQPFADFINAVPKHVVTSRPLEGDWNAQPASGPLPELVASLKAAAEADIGVHASITLAQSLLAEDLVDELCLAVGRVLDPVGPRLFADLPGLRELRLVEATSTSSGSLWLRYRPAAAGA